MERRLWQNGSSTLKAAVVFNGSKDARKLDAYLGQVRARVGRVEFVVYRTEDFGDIEKKADLAVSRGCDLVIAAGGDGTLLGVVNAAIAKNVPCSVLPLGTGNDFALSLAIRSVEDAVSALAEGRITSVDAARCRFQSLENSEREIYFCSTAGIGALARVFSYESSFAARSLKAALGNGAWSILTVVSLLSGRGSQAEITLNGRIISAKLAACEISKVAVTGGVQFTPYAANANGRFDAWTLESMGLMRSLGLFLKAEKPGGSHLTCKGFDYFCDRKELNRWECTNLTEITLCATPPLPFHLHGDFVGYTPCSMSILPGKLDVLYRREGG